MVKEASIIFENVSLGYHHGKNLELVLSGLNFVMMPGELVGIVGINGSGKSTLLRSIAGLLPLLDGTIEIKGKNLNRYSPLELARTVSIVLTERVGGFNLRLEDLVAMGQMPYTDAFHRLREVHRQVIHESIQRCGIHQYREKEVSQLSDGMFQKAMIARALAQQTPVMLLDEPTAFLDYASKHSLFQLLRQLAGEEKKCVLASSHDLELLLKYCHRLLIIGDTSCTLSAADEVSASPDFKKLTGGYL